MKTRIFCILITLLLTLSLCLVVAAPAMAQPPWYVSTTGNDGGAGTSGDPFLTIGHAVSVAFAGDTINVAAGTYVENVNINQALTLVSSVMHGANIQGTVTVAASDVTVDGFHITDFSKIPTPDYSGVYIPSGTNVVAKNNLIDGVAIDPVANLTVGVHTLYNGSAGVLVMDNIIKNVRLGVYNQGAQMTVEGNTIEYINHAAIGVDTELGTTITCNIIRNGGNTGIEVFRLNVVAHDNDITGYTYGVQSFSVYVDALNNWWGDASGPFHASNPGGTGSAVSDDVDFNPWLESIPECVLPPPPPVVGGEVYPVSKMAILAPYAVLVLAIIAIITTRQYVLKRNS